MGDAFYTKVAVLSQSELFHTRTGVTISVPPGLTCVALQATNPNPYRARSLTPIEPLEP